MLSKILGGMFTSFVAIYIWSVLYDEKPNFKSYKLYVGYFAIALLMTLNYWCSILYIKILTLILVLSLCNFFIFRKTIKETVVSSFMCELAAFIAETLFSIFIVLLFKDKDFKSIVDSFFGSIATNLSISVIMLSIAQFKWFKKFYRYLLTYVEKINTTQFLAFLSLFIISYNLLFFTVYARTNLFLAILINTLTTVVYAVIVFKLVQTKNEYVNMFMKYNSTLDSLKEYEKMIDKYKVTNHENKNQLLTIRHMVNEKDKSVVKYIDKIVDNKIKDDEKLSFETSIIPEGGLRAVIYSKLLYMKNSKIKYNFNIDRKIRTVQLIDLGDEIVLDICKIVGVYLDNAIEAVRDLKDGMVNVDLHLDEEKLCIIISNNYEGYVDIEKMDNVKYTTKGDGHGYGLSLVKQIIENNPRLTNRRKIVDDVFTQELQIKM